MKQDKTYYIYLIFTDTIVVSIDFSYTLFTLEYEFHELFMKMISLTVYMLQVVDCKCEIFVLELYFTN